MRCVTQLAAALLHLFSFSSLLYCSVNTNKRINNIYFNIKFMLFGCNSVASPIYRFDSTQRQDADLLRHKNLMFYSPSFHIDWKNTGIFTTVTQVSAVGNVFVIKHNSSRGSQKLHTVQ